MHTQDALGQIIRERRLAAGLTQAQLGESAGYQQGAGAGVSIARVEAGRTMPGPDRLASIAEALRTTAQELLDEAQQRAAAPSSSSNGAEGRLSPKDRLRLAEKTLNERVDTVRARGDAFYHANAAARGEVQPAESGFFLPFAAMADRIDGVEEDQKPQVLLPGDAGFADEADDATQRIQLTRFGISKALLGGAGGLATGAGVGGAAAFGTFTAMATWGSASTGALISGLSGVAATNATLAALGGGALAAGGAGMLGGTLVLAGIVAAPAVVIGGAGFAVVYRKRQRQMSDAADKIEQTLREQQPGYEALIDYLTRATEILEYLHLHGSHALQRWQAPLLAKTDDDGRIAWTTLTEEEQSRYQDFLTLAACHLSVLGISAEAFLAAPSPDSTPAAEPDSAPDGKPTASSLDELRTFSDETLLLAKRTVEALV